MRRRGGALAAAAAAATLLVACGDSGGSGTDRLEAYVKEANAIQRLAQPVFDRADTGYESFAKGELEGTDAERQLRRSELELGEVERRLSALRPPPPARELHRRLLRTYELNIGLAAETRRMAGYVPRSERVLEGLDDVRTRLRDRLREASTAPGQIAALRAYARRLAGVRDRLRGLEVPPVLRATHDSQLRRLTTTRSLALRLSRAIEGQDAAAVARLLAAFRAAGGPDPVGERLAVGAIRAYQQRIAVLTRATAGVRGEQARLQRTLD